MWCKDGHALVGAAVGMACKTGHSHRRTRALTIDLTRLMAGARRASASCATGSRREDHVAAQPAHRRHVLRAGLPRRGPTLPGRLVLLYAPADSSAARAEPDGGALMAITLTPEIAQLIEAARLQGLAQGYRYGHDAAIELIAAGHAQLDILVGPTWREDAVQTVTELRAQERLEREAHAAEVETAWNIQVGRHPGHRYSGGVVDWNTGLPAGSACAWLRNKRLREAGQLATVTTLPTRTERAADRQVAA